MACVTCTKNIKAVRRCEEDREDFTEADGALWPMYVHQGGGQYGFCPAKATWDPRIAEVYRLLVITAQTGAMLEVGGLNDQPSWWIELIGWFLPQYDTVKFTSRARTVLGEGGPSTAKAGDKISRLAGSQPRKATSHGSNNR